MLEAGASTYANLLARYIDEGTINRTDSVFVQFAGAFDQRTCSEVGLVNCTFSNIAPTALSSRLNGGSAFDAHRMPHPDESFDHVIGHSGLHHCSRPHEALHEMYRMARGVVMFVENQDSPLMRLAAGAGVVGYYEHAAVANGEGTGGVDGSATPNHVYRWTRREVLKAVRSFDPGMSVPVDFFTEWNIASGRVSAQVLKRKLHLRSEQTGKRMLAVGQTVLNSLISRQGNIFAASIRKDLATSQPWTV